MAQEFSIIGDILTLMPTIPQGSKMYGNPNAIFNTEPKLAKESVYMGNITQVSQYVNPLQTVGPSRVKQIYPPLAQSTTVRAPPIVAPGNVIIPRQTGFPQTGFPQTAIVPLQQTGFPQQPPLQQTGFPQTAIIPPRTAFPQTGFPQQTPLQPGVIPPQQTGFPQRTPLQPGVIPPQQTAFPQAIIPGQPLGNQPLGNQPLGNQPLGNQPVYQGNIPLGGFGQPAQQAVQGPIYTAEQLNTLRVIDLKAILKSRGFTQSGNKAELIGKILSAQNLQIS